jgi:hypothetical protein
MKYKQNNLNDFTINHVLNRDLVIKMLKFEDQIIHGDVGKSIYEDDSFEHFSSLEAMYTIHRFVLNQFNFKTTDKDVANYRKIFAAYYKSPTDYDKEVLDCVTYMRENKCVYYAGKNFNVGDMFEDVNVYELNGKTLTSLQNKINKNDDYTFIGAFSNT